MRSLLGATTDRWVCEGLFAVLIAAGSFSALAEPYKPTDDDEVLETLPAQLIADRDELDTLRRKLEAGPDNADIAATLAGRYVRLGQQTGDPRYFGYARSAIAPWWTTTDAPAPVLPLRAKLKEAEHRYDEAIADLERITKRAPGNTQAWLDLSRLHRWRGAYGKARQACGRVDRGGGLASLFCSTPLMALTGEAQQAFEQLKARRAQLESEFPGSEADVLYLLAELAVALGRDDWLEQVMDQADAAGIHDVRLDSLLLQYQLDLEEFDAAARLAKQKLEAYHRNDNGYLLLTAIAARRAGKQADAKAYSDQLRERFDALRQRGAAPHARNESRYYLDLEDNPERALKLAVSNWQKQKQPEDSRAVLEAALATNRSDAAQPAIDFLTRHGTEHLALQKLIARLGNLP